MPHEALVEDPAHHIHRPPANHAGAHSDRPEPRRPWTVLGLMLAAQFMVILDVSVVNVALPSIGRALDFTGSDYQWVVSAYVLLSGGLLLLGGRLSDLFDRRKMFLIGLGLFTLASIASGFAVSPLMLIVARGVQGAGAALLTPAALSTIMTTYAGRQRTTALALWGTLGSMGIAAGVLVGGLLTSTLGWQSVFFINIPIGVVVSAMTVRFVSTGARARGTRGVDLPGAITAVAGLLALVFAIEQINSSGWKSPTTLVSLAAAGVLLSGFATIETRVKAPLVPPSMWRLKSLVSASTVMAGITGALVGAIFISSLFLQHVLDSSPIIAGLQFLPLAASITAGAAVASKLLPQLSAKHLMIGGLLIVAAAAAYLSSIAAEPSYWTHVLPGFALLGLGTGPLFVAISVAAMAGIGHEQAGLASGLVMTGHEIGAALGVASLTAVAGDVVTRAGLIDGFPRAFMAITVAMVALAAFTVVAIPRTKPGEGHASKHGMH